MDKKERLNLIKRRTKDTLVDALGIVITDFGDDYVDGKMPVNNQTRQPFGLLHGGASVAFAETLGSMGAGMHIDRNKYSIVGIEINASHLKSVRSGWVYEKAIPIRIGRTIQVWDINITNEKDESVCKSRLTLAVIKKNDR